MTGTVNGKVRVAFIGTGGISRHHASGILAHSDKVECVALCDISEANLKIRSEQLGGVDVRFDDWKTMLREAGDNIDAVVICLPHHLHGRAILDAAAAGKHILCEKPMCTSLTEADEIANAVEQAGITYMSAHNQLFMPAVQEAKRLIDGGSIGEIRYVRSQDCFVMGPGLAGSWRSEAKTQGGGELVDTGYHPCYRLLYLTSAKVVGVRGSMARFDQQIEGEDTACVQIRFDNGAIGEILTSWAFANPYGTHQIHIIGDKGQIFGSKNDLYLLTGEADEPTKLELGEGNMFVDQMGHFADCLIDGKRPIHSVEEGRAVLEIISQATEDAEGWQQYARTKV